MSSKITVPSAGEIRQTAEALNLDLSDHEVEMFGAFMEPMIADYQMVDAMDAPTLPVKYPRGNGYRPDPQENTHNAWYYKAEIKGAASGKLAGKRVVIKDNVSVAGVPMMNGAKVWEGFTPSEDATVVTRVLDAGGTIVGKAVCENLCFSGGSHTSATGPVRNPHNSEHMAGGSSSGCAALLVAGECDLAVGGDQGGSVRMPSSFSGTCGIKPSYGLVPYTGAFPIEQSVDHLGPMAMTSADCALLLEVMAGYDCGLDPRQDSGLMPKPYLEALTGDAKGLRIGVVREGFGTPGSEPDVDDLVRNASRRFADTGADVVDISIPAHTTATSIMLVSMLEGTLATFNDLSGAGTIAKGHFQLDAISFYEKVRKERANDLPVTVKTVLLFALAMRNRYGIYFSAKAQNLIREVRASYDRALAECDLLLMPTTAMKALRIPPAGASQEEIMASALPMIGNTAPFDATGHPSMSIPAGFSQGLPVGMMLTGRFGEDDVVLRAGHAFEQLSD
ncbi:MAG: amidase [Gammaproteobacteria bacterium]